jgi:hypothetical protein
LTIGFARRFATCKRGTLIFRNLERLTAIVNHRERPVQIIFAGKAHPRDHGGKELIAEILHIARRPELRRRVVFLEDYDMNVARYMGMGVDVWLNNPRRPLEASGTSGMKVCGNGGINLSVLDGWWVEGYALDNGWAIGGGEEDAEHDRVGRHREPGDLRPAGAGDRAAVLHARQRRVAARLAEDDEAGDEHGLPGVQHQPRIAELLLAGIGPPVEVDVVSIAPVEPVGRRLPVVVTE